MRRCSHAKEEDMRIGAFLSALLPTLLAAFSLAACEPKAPVAPSFPKATASYKAIYQTAGDQAAPTIYAIPGKQRIEITRNDRHLVTLVDTETRTVQFFQVGAASRPSANKIDLREVERFVYNPDNEAFVSTRAIGADEVLGLACTIWEVRRKASATPREICLTDDAILLRAGPKDAPRMVATAVTRGPQDAALFAPPPGYAVMNIGGCMKIMAEYALALRTGAAEDAAAVRDCREAMKLTASP
jgi:hypothetical protein